MLWLRFGVSAVMRTDFRFRAGVTSFRSAVSVAAAGLFRRRVLFATLTVEM